MGEYLAAPCYRAVILLQRPRQLHLNTRWRAVDALPVSAQRPGPGIGKKGFVLLRTSAIMLAIKSCLFSIA